MNKKIYKYIMFTIIILGIGLYYTNKSNNAITKTEQVKEIQEKDPIKIKIENMTLEEKIGQMIIGGFSSDTMDDEIVKITKDYNIGGLIFFSRNITSYEQTKKLITDINNLQLEIPLFLSLDQEGGRVSRLPKEKEQYPSASQLAQSEDEDYVYQTSKKMSQTIKKYGFNMDFAPVLDINSNPENTVIGDRAFGTDTENVVKYGIKAMDGIKESGIIPVVKHFPGHGDTKVDSHYGLPVVKHPLERLHNMELMPFKKAIDNNIDVIMVSHILVNSIDKNNPASLSYNAITQLLKKDMNFDGLVISDDMTMGAISSILDIGQASEKSVKAGCDLLIIGHESENVYKAINAIKQGVETNRIKESQIDDSVYKIIKLKQKYKIMNL